MVDMWWAGTYTPAINHTGGAKTRADPPRCSSGPDVAPTEVKRKVMTIPTLTELLEAGAHFGHQASHWHPRMSEYIFGARGGIHIINLEKTQEQMEKTFAYLRDVAARGGTILFVGTKAQSKPLVKAAAMACGMPYVTERWLGGTLTNFAQMRDTVNRWLKLREQQAKGELAEKYTKMEQLLISREIEDSAVKVGGIETLKRLPDVVFLSDIRHDKTALLEAISCGIKIAAVCDTNVNPEPIHYVIPMNDDAVRAIELVMRLAAEAINEGKAQAAVPKEETAK